MTIEDVFLIFVNFNTEYAIHYIEFHKQEIFIFTLKIFK